MRWDQYSNILQLAAALSMAGWVARSPDSSLDGGAVPYYNNQHTTVQGSTRYHPYANFNNGFYEGDFEPTPMVQQRIYSNPPDYNIYNSKESEQNFRSFMELQELISWQEAFRRGDLKMGNNDPLHVLPIVNNEDHYPYATNNGFGDVSPPPLSDDGYGSIGISVGSPSPTVLSEVSTNLDDIASLSPISDVVFNPNEFADVQGATGVTPAYDNLDFDIDEILSYANNATPEPTDEKGLAKLDAAKRPFSNLHGIDADLEYVNSPLKSPTFDEFLTNPMPQHYPKSFHDQSFDDPFNMQFTNNTSISNKYFTDTLLEIGDFNPGLEARLSDDEEIDNALVQSLSGKTSKADVPNTLIPASSIKKEFPFLESYITDHDYQKQGTKQNDLSLTKDDMDKLLLRKSLPSASFNDLRKPRQSTTYPSPGRTFAPTNAPKVKKQSRKSSLVWPDLHYTTDELVTMSVDTFNEIIKDLDEVRQHVAKDIRRKGKNKLAARNCRKRKMDMIEGLDQGVEELAQYRAALLEERQTLIDETAQIKQKTEWLNSYIFEHLRDPNGSPYSPSDFSLQYTSDGNVYLVPSVQRKYPSNIKL